MEGVKDGEGRKGERVGRECERWGWQSKGKWKRGGGEENAE